MRGKRTQFFVAQLALTLGLVCILALLISAVRGGEAQAHHPSEVGGEVQPVLPRDRASAEPGAQPSHSANTVAITYTLYLPFTGNNFTTTTSNAVLAQQPTALQLGGVSGLLAMGLMVGLAAVLSLGLFSVTSEEADAPVEAQADGDSTETAADS